MKNKITKSGAIKLVILLVAGLLIGVGSEAADTGQVSATVTAQNITVSVTDGSVSYGTLALSGISATTTGAGNVNDSQIATNDGNVAEDFNIKGASTTAWTLAATQGANQYFHKFCNNGTCDVSPTWTALTTNYQTLGTSIASSGTKEFDLQIGVPSSTATFTQQNADVTVQAVAH
ncbi:MAG TPA: hypothetical protein VK254_00905 [Candidatus Bathyarchaeia archaeon]|nr:hypothetical protein [Candidatus Bathyarchaeia archaeon]